MSCDQGGFVSIRHIDIHYLTAEIVSERCKDIEIEPKLLLVSGEKLYGRTKDRSNGARLDIRAWIFWKRGQQTFFDIRVFDSNVCRYLNKSLHQYNVMTEQDKKDRTTNRCSKSTKELPWCF